MGLMQTSSSMSRNLNLSRFQAGSLPLHLATTFNASEEVVLLLLTAEPTAAATTERVSRVQAQVRSSI
eukprot:3356036-Pleurochrysis_carterae.AAC.1